MKNKTLANYVAPVKLLSSDETSLIFKDKPVSKLCFNGLRNYEYEGKIFGFDLTPSVPQVYLPCSFDDAVKLFVIQVAEAAERANYIFGYNQQAFPLERANRPNFAVSQFLGDRVSFGYKYLEDLANSFGTDSFKPAKLDIQSQYFHEQIHHLGFCGENLPLLGEFLYNPQDNSRRNAIFAQHSQDIDKNIENNKPVPYMEEWRNASIILLKEYKILHPKFKLHETREKQIEVITNLPKLYSKVPKHCRDQIMKKYIHYNADAELPVDREIQDVTSHYVQELKIKY